MSREEHPALKWVLGFAEDQLVNLRVLHSEPDWDELRRLRLIAAWVPADRETSIALARRAWEAAEIAAFLCGGPDVDEAGGRALEELSDPLRDLEQDLDMLEMLIDQRGGCLALEDFNWDRFQAMKGSAPPYLKIVGAPFPIGDREGMNLRAAQMAWCARESWKQTFDSSEHSRRATEAAGAAIYAMEAAAGALAVDRFGLSVGGGLARFLLVEFGGLFAELID